MDFLQGVRGQTLGETAKVLVDEGLITAGTFIGTSFVAGQTEKLLLTKDAAGDPIPISEVSTTSEKVKAWAGNNVPKIAAWMYINGKRNTGIPNAFNDDASKAIATSIFYDTLVRVSNSGVAPAYPTIFGLGDKGIDNTKSMSGDSVQKLLRENAVLKQQITKMVSESRTNALPSQTQINDAPRPERQTRFGFMEPPIVEERRREFGFAGEQPSSQSENIAQMFGML